mgnify:CR=1 FL=1
MATYGPQNYTGFQAVNLKGSVFLRVGHNDPYQGTMGFLGNCLDGNRAWNFPNKSGTFPIAGTFAVQLPALTTNVYSTIVTVAGITAEDGLVVTLKTESPNYVYGTQGTAHVLTEALPGAGQITLTFWNPGNSTGYIRLVGNYVAVR